MIRNPLFRPALMAGVGFAALTAQPAFAAENANENNATQQSAQEPVSAQPGAEDDEVIDTGGAGIVVRAQRLRGQLDVEQAPLLELAEADIAAEGVTSVADLITQITAQTGSSRGRGGGGQGGARGAAAGAGGGGGRRREGARGTGEAGGVEGRRRGNGSGRRSASGRPGRRP